MKFYLKGTYWTWWTCTWVGFPKNHSLILASTTAHTFWLGVLTYCNYISCISYMFSYYPLKIRVITKLKRL